MGARGVLHGATNVRETWKPGDGPGHVERPLRDVRFQTLLVPQFLPPEHEPTHVQIAEQGADRRSLRAAEEFQVWKLTVRPDRSATLTCDHGNGNIVFTKKIEYTDFPLDEITLYFANNAIHLPSEYRPTLSPRWHPRWRGLFLAGRPIPCSCTSRKGWAISAILRVHVIVEEFRRPV